MADEKRIATFEWLNDNLYEFRKGTPPNTKKGVTKTELTTNYNVDESLLTSYTDKRLVTRQNCVGNLGLLGIYGINQTIKIDLKGDRYVIIASDNPSKSSEYYKIFPRELINNSSTLIETDGTVVNTTYKVGATSPIKTTTEFTVLSDNNSVIKTEDGVYSNFDNNYVSSVTEGVENISISPNRMFKYQRYTTGFDYIFNNSTGEQFQKPYKIHGFLFDNLRTYSTLSYKQNYPEESFTTTSYSILSKNNSYLVMEQDGHKVRVSKILEDVSYIPSNVYQGFVDDCNENTNQLKVEYGYVHSCRTFIRDVETFDFTDKEFKCEFAKKLLSGDEGLNDTKVFVRFGDSDLTHNYVECEVTIPNINGVNYSDIWNLMSFKGSDAVDGIVQRDLEGFDLLQRYNHNLGDKVVYVKGTIDLSSIKKIMIGIRNKEGLPIRSVLLWTKNPKIFLGSIEQFPINIRRKVVKVYNYNIYPFLVDNEEGVMLVVNSDGSNDKDVLSDIGFKQEIVWERNVPNVVSAEMITHRSNIEEGFIKIKYNSGNIETRRASDFSLINSGVEPLTSTIISPTKNMIIYKQADSNIVDIDINGSSRQMISIVQDV